MSASFNPENNELTTDIRMNPAGLSRDELVLGGCGLFRASVLEMLAMLLQAGVEVIGVQDLIELISEAELELEEVERGA